ncbi:recombinase RecT [Sodalis sp. (in: enterobacteria)]|uniref:recombinase RecT n=1 Tax=Sodalis sp. (in: enterobacteria) TaxID=1898979 RepID=UPI003F3F54BB
MKKSSNKFNFIEQYHQGSTHNPIIDDLVKRIKETGCIDNIVATVVYDADKFDYWIDERGKHLKHKPVFENRGAVRLVYAVAKTHGGEIDIEVIPRHQISAAILKMDSTTCHNPFTEALICACSCLCSRLPGASEMLSLFDSDADKFADTNDSD